MAAERQPDLLSAGGAFIDTTGESRLKRKKQTKIVHEERDREEEAELEALVFGRQPFQPRRRSESNSDEVRDDVMLN